MITAWSPGKLIISGEHAVVYGQPAIAAAVHPHAKVTAYAGGKTLRLQVADLDTTYELNVEQLHDLSSQAESRREAFLADACPITDVLDDPLDLLLIAASKGMRGVFAGMEVSLDLEIPLGCGMGSSAAAGLAILNAVAAVLDQELSKDQLEQMSKEVEGFQHGRPSGVDSAVCAQGGMVKFHDGACNHLEAEAYAPLLNTCMILVTGKPEATTGECVSAVREHHASSPVWPYFGEVTEAVEDAMRQDSMAAFLKAIHENHRLLHEIGVVPEPASDLISQIRHAGGAAKICGAGSIRGDQAGAVLVAGVKHEWLKAVTEQTEMTLYPMEVDHAGTCLR